MKREEKYYQNIKKCIKTENDNISKIVFQLLKYRKNNNKMKK